MVGRGRKLVCGWIWDTIWETPAISPPCSKAFVEFHRIGWSMEFARDFFSSHGRLVRSGYVCWIAARMIRYHVLRGLRCSREQS